MEEYRQKPAPILEITVVIIIVIVVGAILFPVFARSGSHPGKSRCQNNLKVIAVAMHLYWNDYDGNLPSSAIVSHSKKWNRSDFIRFATTEGALPLPAGKNPNTWPELLFDYIMKDKDTLYCHKDTEVRSKRGSRVSYWYKLAVDKAWYGEGCSKPCMNEKDFTYNADQIVFYEHQGWHFGSTDGLQNGVQINVAYMDSHVKTIVLKSATSGDPINCAANSSGSPMYFNFDNKRPKNDTDNPNPTAPAMYIDPTRYSDSL